MLSFFGLLFFLPAAFAFQVFLDAGHGGQDRGASYGKIVEKTIALSVTKRVGQLLEQHSGIQVTYSRTTDVYRSLQQRVSMANKDHPNLFLSIHVNASPDRRACGPDIYFQNVLDPDQETLFLANLENQNLRDASNSRPSEHYVKDPDVNAIIDDLERDHRIQLSSIFSEDLHKYWDGDYAVSSSQDIRQAPFYVISNVNAPAALLELGYLTNPIEGPLLTKAAYQNKIAKGIVNAIIKYKDVVDKRSQQSLD